MNLINEDLAKIYFKYQLLKDLSLLRCIGKLEAMQILKIAE